MLRGLERNAEAREQLSAACGAGMQVACKAGEQIGGGK
jgi:hypothetical protein